MYSVSYWRRKSSESTERVSILFRRLRIHGGSGKEEAIFGKTSAKHNELRMKIRMKA
jgi:hypothetical protein